MSNQRKRKNLLLCEDSIQVFIDIANAEDARLLRYSLHKSGYVERWKKEWKSREFLSENTLPTGSISLG